MSCFFYYYYFFYNSTIQVLSFCSLAVYYSYIIHTFQDGRTRVSFKSFKFTKIVGVFMPPFHFWFLLINWRASHIVKMWAFIPICLLCPMVWRMPLVGVGSWPSAVEWEGRAPVPCLWASCAGATTDWIGEPFTVGVDGMSSVGYERHAPGLCLWASCAETAAERTGDLGVSLRGFEFSSWWSVWT